MRQILPISANTIHSNLQQSVYINPQNCRQMKVTPPSYHTRSDQEIYFSAPSSPSNLSDQSHDTLFDDFDNSRSSVSYVPFVWEEKPGTPKSQGKNTDFEFAFSVGKAEPETASLSAAELFHGGVIKPLKLPPCLQAPQGERAASASQPPRLLQTWKMMHGRDQSFDPFEIAARNATKAEVRDIRGGRDRDVNLQKSSSRKTSRSLSPCRVTKYAWKDYDKQWHQPWDSVRMSSPEPSLRCENRKRWRLKNLFLFRSTSKGRGGAGEDKYYSKCYIATFRRWSFRDTVRPGSDRGSNSDGPASVSRSDSKDFVDKKKFLSYNHGIVGALARCGFTSKKLI